MTLKEFNKKYENIIINGINLKNVSNDEELRAIITEIDRHPIFYSKIYKDKNIVGDILRLQKPWNIEPTRICYRFEEQGDK